MLLLELRSHLLGRALTHRTLLLERTLVLGARLFDTRRCFVQPTPKSVDLASPLLGPGVFLLELGLLLGGALALGTRRLDTTHVLRAVLLELCPRLVECAVAIATLSLELGLRLLECTLTLRPLVLDRTLALRALLGQHTFALGTLLFE